MRRNAREIDLSMWVSAEAWTLMPMLFPFSIKACFDEISAVNISLILTDPTDLLTGHKQNLT